ncbi:MAG: cobamide remodeling phosphodiesterase CbiR [Candidatus Helarchaeota archaeon]
MKFGITPINFDILDESFDLKNLKFPLLVEKAINAGYKHIEITMDLEYVIPGSLSKRIIKKLFKLKEENDISYSVHLPLWSIEPASPNKWIRDASCNCIVESIVRTKILDPVAYVLHLTGALAAEFSRVNLPLEIKKQVIDLINIFASTSIENILANVDISSEKIAVENVEFPFDATRKLIDKYNLSICFDSGHLLAGYSGNSTVKEFLDKNIDKIIEFHLNDAKILDGRPNDHIAIGDGNFPIDEIQTIIDSEFNGPLVFELTFRDAEKSLNIIKKNYPNLFK